MFEVEMKFKVEDPFKYECKLKEFYGVVLGDIRVESDLFLQPFNRDFRQTDECLRIRSCGDELNITYKGPKLDFVSKTREEIELPLYLPCFSNIKPEISKVEIEEKWLIMFERLGFRRAAQLIKKRREGTLILEDQMVSITLDEIEGRGFFTELEVIVAEKVKIPFVRDVLTRFAVENALGTGIRKSYLELVEG